MVDIERQLLNNVVITIKKKEVILFFKLFAELM